MQVVTNNPRYKIRSSFFSPSIAISQFATIASTSDKLSMPPRYYQVVFWKCGIVLPLQLYQVAYDMYTLSVYLIDTLPVYMLYDDSMW